jgi:S-DNA-T family DNA segregation ATPase FtsK/SpoIIIE
MGVAKRARADKSVLTRQEISSRKRALKEQKLQAHGTGRRAIAGVFILAASLLTLIAVATYDPRDRTSLTFRNAIGPVGHNLADGLRSLLGVCAYLLPIAGLYAAASVVVGKRRRRWAQLLSLVLLTGSGAVLAQLALSGQPMLGHPPGGWVGETLGGTLCDLFSTVGTLILVTSVCLAALIVGTQFVFLKACALIGHAIATAGRSVAAGAAMLWAGLHAGWRSKREADAKSKLEEQAFLAQLEADEDEIVAAEKAAQEAEAAAEEAERLAREKRERKEARRPPRREAAADAVTDPGSPAPEDSGEPAWAASLAPLKPVKDPPSERRRPQIVTPPKSDAPTAEAGTPKAANGSVPEAALAVAGRQPIIVEPKAPPKPTKKKDQEQFQFVGGRTSFTLPPIDVLSCDKKEHSTLDKEVFLSTAERLRAKLADFGIEGEVVEIRPGPVVTMYEFLPGPGIKISKIASLADDLAMAMEAMRVRIVAPIPGKGVVGIEVPNKDRETVYLKEIAEQDTFQKSASKLTMCLGKDIEGMPYILDLSKAPHLLIAGTTGSGKSVAVNSMIMSILLKATPEEVRFVMVDPKMLELSVYEGIPHLLLPVVTDPRKAALALRWAVEEMERRYHLLSEAGVRNIAGYNKLVDSVSGDAKKLLQSDVKNAAPAPAGEETAPKNGKRKLLIVDVAEAEQSIGVAAPRDAPEDIREPALAKVEPSVEPDGADGESEISPEAVAAAQDAAQSEEKAELKKLPYIVVIIDELADLMMVCTREVETYVARLAQMARAAGIHLMVATQRPSTDVVTGVIKANFPTRISFMLRSKPDSMTILGTTGAEALLGMGDMLIMPPTSAHMQRVHGAYVSESEIKRAVDHLKAQGKPVYDESILKAREEDSEGLPEEDELSDELYDQAMAVVSEMRQVSISMLQRKMRIGYNRAARMIERMERDGVVGPADGAKPREVLLRPVGEMPGAGAM